MKYKRSLSCGYDINVSSRTREICYRGQLGLLDRKSLVLTLTKQNCPKCGKI